jgi:hypothetical protein
VVRAYSFGLVGKPQVILGPYTTSQLAPSPVKSAYRNVAFLLGLASAHIPMIPVSHAEASVDSGISLVAWNCWTQILVLRTFGS